MSLDKHLKKLFATIIKDGGKTVQVYWVQGNQ